MEHLLRDINRTVDQAVGALDHDETEAILKQAEIECPPPIPPPGRPKRGKLKRSKARNLLERLKDYEDDVLRFIENPDVPFTNNRGENDIRMTKVQQKISGCFRSMKGAQMSCRIRGYLSSRRKQGMSATQAMSLVFEENSQRLLSLMIYAELPKF